MVMPRSRSSGALSIESKARNSAPPFRARYLVMAAVSVVLPWSMWPIVPILTCGLVRSNFFFAIAGCSLAPIAGWVDWSDSGLLNELGRHAGGDLGVVGKLHRVAGAALRHRPQVGGVAEHRGQRDSRPDDLRRAARLHRL